MPGRRNEGCRNAAPSRGNLEKEGGRMGKEREGDELEKSPTRAEINIKARNEFLIYL